MHLTAQRFFHFLFLFLVILNVISTAEPDLQNVSSELPKTEEEDEETAFDLEDDPEADSPKARASQLRELITQELAVNPFKKIGSATSSSNSTQIGAQWSQLINAIAQQHSVLTLNVLSPILFDIMTDTPELSPKCYGALIKLGDALQRSQIWAWKMVDANGRLTSGLFSGTLGSFGDFDQCLGVVVVQDEEIITQGQYCLLELAFPVPNLAPGERLRMEDRKNLKALLEALAQLNTKLNLADTELQSALQLYINGIYSFSMVSGICIPSACSAVDIEMLAKTGNFTQINVNNCIAQDYQPDVGQLKLLERWIVWANGFLEKLDFFQWISLVTFLGCASLVLLGTFFDCIEILQLLPRQQEGAMTIFTDAFSIRSNWNRLFRKSTSPQNEKNDTIDLRFLNGLRVCTMFWIVFIHCSIMGAIAVGILVYRLLAEARPFARSFSMQFVFNGYASVDIFFFISGFVLAFLILRSKAPSTSTSGSLFQLPPLLYYIILRAARLVIPMAGLLAIHFLWPLLGSGPVFGKFSTELLDACRANGWKNLLLIGNYENGDQICLVHTWFLSADFQLHLLAYPLAMVFRISEKIGIVLNIVLILAGVVASGALHYQRNATAAIAAFLEAVNAHFNADMKYLYFPAYIHLAPYFIGFLTGYLMLKRVVHGGGSFSGLFGKRPSSIQLIIMTAAILTASAASIFGAYAWSREEGELVSSQAAGSVYFALHRVVFILAPVWIVWLCVWYPKNSIARLLSTNLMQILGRLSFSIYLVHLPIIWYLILTSRSQFRFTFINMLFMYGGVLLFTLPLSFVFHCTFEGPWAVLIRRSMRREVKKTDEKGEEKEGEATPEVRTTRCL